MWIPGLAFLNPDPVHPGLKLDDVAAIQAAPPQESPRPVPAQGITADSQQKSIKAKGLKVTFDSHWVSLAERRQVFTGKVRAEYDVTIIEADELEIDEAKKIGWARGGVKITDPEGEVALEEFTFRWKDEGEPPFGPTEEIGTGSNARIRAGNVLLEAKTIRVTGESWILMDAWGSLTQRNRPEWKIRARKVTLIPGVRGTAEHIFLETLGLRLGPLPRYSFNLNPRIESKFVLPTYTRDERGEFGFAWSFARPLTDNSAIRGSWSSFPRQATSWNLTYSFSPLSSRSTSSLISVPSDLSERFDDGWMDNIQVIGPDKEAEDFRTKRLNWQVQTDWNSGASTRKVSPENVVRMLDVANEQGGAIGPHGSRLVSRFQVIRSKPDEEFRPRFLAHAGIQGAKWKLGGGLSSVVRLDSLTTLSSKTAYGWARAQAAMIFQPSKEATLGLAYVAGADLGTPDFEYDRLFSSQAVHFRADLRRGPFSAHWLAKYDFDLGLIYDREYEVSYVAGAFEPYIQYRQQPGFYQLGIRFRMDNVAQRLVSREQKRRSP
jgi:hypothetical protein